MGLFLMGVESLGGWFGGVRSGLTWRGVGSLSSRFEADDGLRGREGSFAETAVLIVPAMNP